MTEPTQLRSFRRW